MVSIMLAYFCVLDAILKHLRKGLAKEKNPLSRICGLLATVLLIALASLAVTEILSVYTYLVRTQQ